MPPRAYWKGHLKLSLINIPIRLFTASNSGTKIALNQIHRESMQRVRYQTMAGDEPVARSEIVKGYEFEKGKYVLIEDADFEKIRLETDKTIEITQFIDQAELDPVYLGSPYYAAPDGAVAEAPFRVIREGLNQTGKVGLGRVVMHNREHVVCLSVRDKGFLLTMMRYAGEIRATEAYFDEITDGDVDEAQLQLAVQLIEGLSSPFDYTQFRDRYQDALLELIKAKVDGSEPAAVQEAEATQVFNFMDALKQSIAQAPARKKPPAKSVRTTKAARSKKKKA